jgi:signal transduction histidine kinase
MSLTKAFFGWKCERMRIFILHLLFFGLFCFEALSFQIADSSKTSEPDSIVFHEFDGSLYRASSVSYRVVEDEDGILYFGNENGMLEFDGTHWDLYQKPNFGRIENLKIVGDKIYTIGAGDIGYFQRDSLGQMKYFSLNDKLSEDEMPYAWSIVESKGNIYLGSVFQGIYIFDGEIIEKISIKDVYSMVEINGEVLLSIFGIEGGLAKVVGDTIEFVNKKFKFEEDAAYNIIQKNENEWLIFTSEEGFYSLDPNTYETELWDTEVNQYFMQDSTYLWHVEKFRDSLFVASTWENGIVVFNDKGKIKKVFNEDNGLNYNFYNVLKSDRRGNLWITNTPRINYLKWHDKDEELNFPAKALVRYMRLGDSTIYVKGSKDNVRLSDGKSKSISLYFSVPSFMKQDLEFSYYLEGFDEDWSEWTTDTRKEYTNLSGGNYTFHLRARNISNTSIDVLPFEFDITVPIKWYESYWTYILLGLTAGLLIFGFIRYRTHRLSVTNKKLESIVKERTSELRSQKERLKKANEELKTINHELDNFVYRSSHDLVAPLKSLRGLIAVAEMANSVEDIKKYFKYMNVSITKLEDFIRSIMDFSTNTKKPLETKLVKMDTILDSIVEDLKYYENADKVELVRAYDSEFEIKTDPKRLNIVLSNLVTNALKYHDFEKDEKPYIKVSSKIENNSYIIEVEDNGSGIPEEYQSKIFEMFFRAHQGIEGSGLGLYIVVDTLNVLKGKISFTSKTRVGTTFKVELPLID